jgi:hypothetical protein
MFKLRGASFAHGFRATFVASGLGILFGFVLPCCGQRLQVHWTNNLLTVSGTNIPGGRLDVWYLEAFCRRGAWNRDWHETTFRHKTQLVFADPRGHVLRFLTTVDPDVEVRHDVHANRDTVDLRFTLRNRGREFVDLNWFQPACLRVDRFTGTNQAGYIYRSFIFTERGLIRLADTRRTEEALYRGGQVYLPKGIDRSDANPRPLSADRPINGLIGCWSADNRYLLATASDSTHELFEGVYVCLHSDPKVGGLAPGETKQIRARIYIMENDVDALLKRYRRDFKR